MLLFSFLSGRHKVPREEAVDSPHRKRGGIVRKVPLGRLLLAEDHLALTHKLLIEPQAVFVRRGSAAGTRRSAEQADSRGRLKNVRRKRAAVHVKLDAQVSRVGNPG